MRDVKWAVFIIEAVTLLVLGAAYVISGRLLGAAILLSLATLAAGCTWAFWPAAAFPRARAGESPRRAESSPPPRR